MKLRKQWNVSGTAIALAVANAMVVAPSDAALIPVGGSCTFNEAITSANNDNAGGNGCVSGSGADTISLSSNVVFSQDFQGGFTAAPFITSEITIEGNGNGLIRSLATSIPSFRLLAVTTANGNLTLNDLIINNGNLPYNGAGIYVGGEASLTTDNVTITGNRATSGSGGGIFSRGGTVTIQNSTIRGNTASQNGGGIAGVRLTSGELNFSTLTISNTTVSGNSAQQGGGIFSYGRGEVSIAGSLVLENTATLQGGALSASRFVIENTDITDNIASSGGGIFSLADGVRTISGSTISGNTALPSGGSGYSLCDDDQVQPPQNWPGYGGGILSRGGVPDLLHSTVTGNDADCGGGMAVTAANTSVAAVTGSVISNNTARDGGGMFITSHPLTVVQSLSLNGGTLSGNYARFGGGIHTRNSQLTLSNMTLHNNSAFNGGGIRADKSPVLINATEIIELTMSNVTLSGNTADLIGGGLQATDTEVALYNATIAFNSSVNEVNNPGTINGGGGMRVSVKINSSPRGSLKLRNTVVSGSGGSDCLDTSYFGDIANEDIDNSNIIQDGGCNTPALAVNPRLLPLADNGGQNQTHEMERTSPAIDAGDNTVCAAAPVNGLDQRGVSRPNGSACDMGAVESQFVSDDGGFIVIPLPDGKTVTVPL
jgi:hypothetical protein